MRGIGVGAFGRDGRLIDGIPLGADEPPRFDTDEALWFEYCETFEQINGVLEVFDKLALEVVASAVGEGIPCSGPLVAGSPHKLILTPYF